MISVCDSILDSIDAANYNDNEDEIQEVVETLLAMKNEVIYYCIQYARHNDLRIIIIRYMTNRDVLHILNTVKLNDLEEDQEFRKLVLFEKFISESYI